jgi:nitrate/nitrite transporter NarK
MGIINMCGNMAGLVVPVAVGWVRARTGSFDVPVYAIAATLVLGACSVLLLRLWVGTRSGQSQRERVSLTPDTEAASR